jgi:high-affinity nickel-transport protein
MLTLLSIILFGFFIGMRHATDTDHVVAVTTFVSRERSVKSAALIGMIWGVGHSLTVVGVGAAIVLFGLVIPPKLGMSLEFGVALMLIVLGLVNLRSVFRWAWGTPPGGAVSESPTEVHLRTWLDKRFGKLSSRQMMRPFIVGIVHGLAGSASLALLALPLIQKAGWALAYLLVFGFGTIAGMMLITAAIAWPCASFASRSVNLSRRLAAASGMLSLGFGLFLVYDIGFAQGLFLAMK